MNIDIITRKTELEKAERELAQERIERTCSRFANMVRRVTLRLKDINGPKGGNDKECLVTVELTDGRVLTGSRCEARNGLAIARSLDVIKSKLRKVYGQRNQQRKALLAQVSAA